MNDEKTWSDHLFRILNGLTNVALVVAVGVLIYAIYINYY